MLRTRSFPPGVRAGGLGPHVFLRELRGRPWDGMRDPGPVDPLLAGGLGSGNPAPPSGVGGAIEGPQVEGPPSRAFLALF